MLVELPVGLTHMYVVCVMLHLAWLFCLVADGPGVWFVRLSINLGWQCRGFRASCHCCLAWSKA